MTIFYMLFLIIITVFILFIIGRVIFFINFINRAEAEDKHFDKYFKYRIDNELFLIKNQ